MTKTTTEITAQQIQMWKKQYGDDCVHKYTTSDGLIAFFRSPDRKIISFATITAKNDTMRFKEILADNCWLAGDDRIKTEDKYFLGLSTCIIDLVEYVEGTLEKA